jgi:hypothetical protein
MSEEREQRNAVFTNVGVDPRIPTTTAADRARADFGLDIPVEVVPLPSMGRVYPANSSLHGRETVDIRAMTAREEDILTSRALLKKGTVITELIKSCLTDKAINTSELLVGDRNALMVAVRITGYGAEYEVEVDCTECGSKTPHVFNLGELPIRRLEINPVEEGMNLFETVLPVCKKTVRFKFLTGRDEEEISATSEKQKKLALGTDTAVTTNLMYAIVAVDGVTDRAKLANFVKMMPARDSLALRNFIRDNEPGIILKQEAACESCGHTEDLDMPLGVSFLWPSVRR